MERRDTPIGHPFPSTRPNVEIAESGEPIGEVDCVELRWWFAVPRPGERTMWAGYDADTLKLARVTDIGARGPANVHGTDCVEMRVEEWSAGGWRKTESFRFYARVEDDAESRWLAVASEGDGEEAFVGARFSTGATTAATTGVGTC